MKNGTGLNVLKAIRQSEAPEHRTLVIVLTNHAFSLYRYSCLEAGADSFLDKAHDYGRLVEILTAAVEGEATVDDSHRGLDLNEPSLELARRNRQP